MNKLLLVSASLVAVLAGCSEDTSEPTSSSEDAVVNQPERDISFAKPVTPEAPAVEEEGTTTLSAKESRKSAFINLKPTFEIPTPPTATQVEPNAR